MKFISELIKIKLISKKTIKYCICTLIYSFLQGYYDYFVAENRSLNYYEFYFEALIEFLENLGNKFEEIDEKDKADKEDDAQSKAQNLPEVEEKLRQYCNLEKKFDVINGFGDLKAGEYFNVFKVVSDICLPKARDGRRIIALLQNLEERRFNNWKKHNAES